MTEPAQDIYQTLAGIFRGDVQVRNADELSNADALACVQLLAASPFLAEKIPELVPIIKEAGRVQSAGAARGILESAVDALDKGFDAPTISGDAQAQAEFSGLSDDGDSEFQGRWGFTSGLCERGWLTVADVEKLCIGCRTSTLKPIILLVIDSPELHLSKEQLIAFGAGNKKPRTYISPTYFSWLLDKGFLKLREMASPFADVEGGEKSANMLSNVFIGGDTDINMRFRRFIKMKTEELQEAYPEASVEQINYFVSRLYVGMRKPSRGQEALYATSEAIEEMEKLGILKRLEKAASSPRGGEVSVFQLSALFQGGNMLIKPKLKGFLQTKERELIEQGMDVEWAEAHVDKHFGGLRKPEAGQEGLYATPLAINEMRSLGLLRDPPDVPRAGPGELGTAILQKEIVRGSPNTITEKIETYRDDLIKRVREQCPDLENPEGGIPK